MSPSRLPIGRYLLVPMIVLAVGAGLSTAVFVRLETQARAESAQRLNEVGQQLVSEGIDSAEEAINHATATKALFESSVLVTRQEFDHFVGTIDSSPETGIGYAARVLVDDLDAFLQATRRNSRTYRIFDAQSETVPEQEGRVYWPLLYSSGLQAGFATGFDFGSHASVRPAIHYSVRTGESAATVFLEIPGDDEPGDFLIIAAIGEPATSTGLAIVTLRLDELLAGRAEELLGSDVVISLKQHSEVAGFADEQKAWSHWLGEFNVAGQPINVEIDSEGLLVASPLSRWILGLGLGVSGLLAWAVYGLRRRSALNAQLVALEDTLAEKDRFLAGVSHAVRTPMTSIVGNLEILDDPKIHLEKAMKATLIHDARIGALDLERITDDYLIAARISSGAIAIKNRPVDLDFLTKQIVASTDVPLGIHVNIEPLGRCLGDNLRLRHVIRNLIRNATQHAATTIEINAVIEASHLRINFINDGKPIPSELVDQLFTPFGKVIVSTQPETIGLGLSVARDLARLMGGDLTYNHREGHIVFQLTLPRDKTVGPKSVPPRPPHGTRRNRRDSNNHIGTA